MLYWTSVVVLSERTILKTIPHHDVFMVTVKRSVIVTCSTAKEIFILHYQKLRRDVRPHTNNFLKILLHKFCEESVW